MKNTLASDALPVRNNTNETLLSVGRKNTAHEGEKSFSPETCAFRIWSAQMSGTFSQSDDIDDMPEE